MPLTVKTFEVATDNEKAALAFDLRGAVLDFIRMRIAETLVRAEDADIDRQTAMRRFSMTYAGAAKGYRLPRAVPSGLVSWAGYVEYNAGREGFPAAPEGTVGTFSKDGVATLPGGLLLIKMGGVMFIGTGPEGGIPADLFETRIHKGTNGKYIATFVCGRLDNGGGADVPVPVDPEEVDA